MYKCFEEACASWEDTPAVHTEVFRTFFDLVQQDTMLREHRDIVEAGDYGFGDRPFHWMWNLIVDDMPQKFRFLEIGVFQGQVISLVSLLSERMSKNGSIVGLTPLGKVDDKFSNFADVNYEERLCTLHALTRASLANTTVVQGLSTDPETAAEAINLGPYDCVYIDGGHDYPTVRSDIHVFAPTVKVGGLLVMDDAANFLKIPDGLIRMDWRGIMEVSEAVRDHLESDSRFQHIFSCGHNRVWRRMS